MKRHHFIILVLGITLITTDYARAAITAGTKCPKANQTRQYQGRAFTCLKLGKSMFWSNGVLISKPSPKATVTLTPTPAPTVTVTATPSAAPSATPSKALLPSTLLATIKFTGGALSYSSWGDGLSHLYCDIPADAPNQPMFPNYGVATVKWSQTNM
jgi:hypothetical protein